jgi:hypothetical protein
MACGYIELEPCGDYDVCNGVAKAAFSYCKRLLRRRIGDSKELI